MLEAVRRLDREHGPSVRGGNPSGRQAGFGLYSECFAEHDRYRRTICRSLEDGIDEFRLAAYSSQVRTVGVGLSRADEDRDMLIARRLLDLPA